MLLPSKLTSGLPVIYSPTIRVTGSNLAVMTSVRHNPFLETNWTMVSRGHMPLRSDPVGSGALPTILILDVQSCQGWRGVDITGTVYPGSASARTRRLDVRYEVCFATEPSGVAGGSLRRDCGFSSARMLAAKGRQTFEQKKRNLAL